jgi:hypothetical protein
MRRWFMTAAVMAGAMLLIAAAGDAATRRAAAQAQPAPAAAADENGPSNAALAALLPSEPGSRACYVRIYDAAHLREHHNQRVTAVMFLLRVARLDADGNHHFTPAAAAYSQDRIRYQFAMQVKRRGAHGTLGAGLFRQ